MKYWNQYCSKNKIPHLDRWHSWWAGEVDRYLPWHLSQLYCMHWSFVSYERIFARFCWWTLKDSSCFKYLCTHKYSSLTWCAVNSGSSHSHPLFSSWEFFSDPSSQDRSQTGDKNAISQIGRDPRLFCDFFEKLIFWLITGPLWVNFYICYD